MPFQLEHEAPAWKIVGLGGGNSFHRLSRRLVTQSVHLLDQFGQPQPAIARGTTNLER